MSLLDTFLGAVAGPASTLGSVAPPLSSSQVSAGANLSAGVSTTGISGSISIIGGQTTGVLGGLPDPLQTLRPIAAVVEMAERVTKDDPSAQIQAFLDPDDGHAFSAAPRLFSRPACTGGRDGFVRPGTQGNYRSSKDGLWSRATRFRSVSDPCRGTDRFCRHNPRGRRLDGP